MLDFINGVISSIADFFSRIWDIINWVFDEITQFFQIIKPAIKFFQTLFSSLPPLFVGFGIAILTVLIVYLIIGRQAGGD